MMTFQQIRGIIEIAHYGSISKAASHMHIAQPYLSNLLKELESAIGIQIFTRTSKGVTLTNEGKEFIRYVLPLAEQHDKILDMYTRKTVEPAMCKSISTQRFPFVVKAFIEYYNEQRPDKFHFYLREVGMYRVISDVFEKKSDIGILYMSDMSENFIKRALANKDLEFCRIATLTPRVFFNKKHPMAKNDVVSLEEMYFYPFITCEEETFVSREFSEEIVLWDVSPSQKRFCVEDRATIINILTNTDAFSIGTGILPYGFAGAELTSRKIEGHDSEIKLGYIKPKSSVLDGFLLEIIDRIKSNIIRQEPHSI